MASIRHGEWLDQVPCHRSGGSDGFELSRGQLKWKKDVGRERGNNALSRRWIIKPSQGDRCAINTRPRCGGSPYAGNRRRACIALVKATTRILFPSTYKARQCHSTANNPEVKGNLVTPCSLRTSALFPVALFWKSPNFHIIAPYASYLIH